MKNFQDTTSCRQFGFLRKMELSFMFEYELKSNSDTFYFFHKFDRQENVK